MAFPVIPAISFKFVGHNYDLNADLTPAQIWAALDTGAEEVRQDLIEVVDTIEAEYETITDLATNRKLSATGDFTGTLNGAEITAAEPGLSSVVDAHLAEYADLSALVWNDTGADNTDAFNAAVLSGKRIMLKSGTLTIKGIIRLDLAPHNSYIIQGSGENTVLNFVGSGAGLFDEYGAQDGLNYHVKEMKNFILQGDLTNIGFECSSLCLKADNLVITGFDKGLYVHDGGYGCKFTNCYFRENKYGIYFGALVTTLEFDALLCMNHNDQTGAAIYFDSPVEMIKIKGILQANKAPAIWYGTSFSGDVEIDCYFELNGDDANNIESVKNDAVAGEIIYRNSKVPRNQVGSWISGDYQLGYNVICDNCKLFAKTNVTNSLSLINCLVDSDGGVSFVPTIIKGFTRFGTLFGYGGSSGFGFQLPPIIKEGKYNIVNKHTNPFSAAAASVTATGTNQPTVTQDTVTKFSTYNSTKIAFVDNKIGSIGENSVYLLGSSATITQDAGNVVVFSFFIKGNQDGLVRVNFVGEIQAVLIDIPVDTNWKKIVVLGKNPQVAAKYVRGYLFCYSLLTSFEVNVTGLCMYENVPNNMSLFSEMLDGCFIY